MKDLLRLGKDSGSVCKMICLLCLISVWGTGCSKKELSEDRIIRPGERVGTITRQSTPKEIADRYGASNIVQKPFYVGEGEELPGLILFPDSPEKLEIALDQDSSVLFVRISHDRSPWITKNGIRIGLGLEDLQRINKGPFAFYGFDWDYSGLVADWENGVLSPSLIIALIPGNDRPLPAELLGDHLLSSENALLNHYNIKVGSIVITFDE